MTNGGHTKTMIFRSRTWKRVTCAVLLSACVLAGVLGLRYWQSRDPARTFERARIALRSGDLEGVQRAIERLRRAPAYANHSRYLKGAVLLRTGRFTEALAEFREAVDQPELEVDVLVLSGQALYQTGRAREARELWERALKLNPLAVNAHRWLGVLYYDLGAMEYALTHLEQVSRSAPDDPRADRLMGLVYKDYERYSEAVACYEESLRRDPDQPDRDQMLLELAESQIQLGLYGSALDTLRPCPRSPKQLVLQAECHFGLGEVGHARRINEELLQMAPEYLPSLQLQGRILLENGDVEEAAELLSRAATLHPKDYAVHYSLARAYGLAGDEAKSQEYVERAEQLKNTWKEFADLHQQAMNEPLNARLRYQLGKISQQLDRPDLAEMWFRAALAIEPTHAGAAKALRPAR